MEFLRADPMEFLKADLKVS
jgi:hypothetical protein